MLFKSNSGFFGCAHCLFALMALMSTPCAQAWTQEYIGSEAQSYTPERFTWDSERAPNYNDILTERIHASLTQPGVAFSIEDGAAVDPTRSLSVQLNIPLGNQMTTGPVAGWRYDDTSASIWNAFGDSASTTTQNDPLWHASISTLGWRINTQPLWGVHPWAQISFNQQFGENQWKSQSGLNRTPTSTQDGSWRDVTLGADMLLKPNFSAYASFSQADNVSENTHYIYMMGMRARF